MTPEEVMEAAKEGLPQIWARKYIGGTEVATTCKSD